MILHKIKEPDSYSYIEAWYEKAKADTFLDRTLYVDVHTYLPDDLLVKVDIATMAHALEARSPFLDHRYAIRCISASSSQTKGLETKYFLKKAFRGSSRKRF